MWGLLTVGTYLSAPLVDVGCLLRNVRRSKAFQMTIHGKARRPAAIGKWGTQCHQHWLRLWGGLSSMQGGDSHADSMGRV